MSWALDVRKKLLGAEHPDILISMANLASTYSSQGKWNEAEQLRGPRIGPSPDLDQISSQASQDVHSTGNSFHFLK